MPEDDREREAGAWIGRQPDPNTEQVRRDLDAGDERVAVRETESDDATVDDAVPRGHRQGKRVSDDDVRRAGHGG